MIDALGAPQSLLLLGGTSDIARAIARAYAVASPGLRVVLAARASTRRDEAAEELETLGCKVECVDFEATDPAAHQAALDAASSSGDVDVAVVAYGLLGDNERAWTEPEEALALAQTNFVGPVASGVALGELVRRQGHGVIVVLSSVAGERPRRSNFVYGATKAGMDAFFTGLGEALRPFGGRVLVVRPGFVRSRMTEGLEAAPLATTPEAVATAVVDAVAVGREQIWVPGSMRAVMSALRHVPRPLFRRLPI